MTQIKEGDWVYIPKGTRLYHAGTNKWRRAVKSRCRRVTVIFGPTSAFVPNRSHRLPGTTDPTVSWDEVGRAFGVGARIKDVRRVGP